MTEQIEKMDQEVKATPDNLPGDSALYEVRRIFGHKILWQFSSISLKRAVRG